MTTISIDRATDLAKRLLETLGASVLGQTGAIAQLTAAFMAGGHALLEGVPGIGKTLLAKSFARTLGLEFARIQFTPDLMPSDVVGVNVFDTDTGSFELQRGPIFTDVLMADEINRTPPKTQSALLEAMQEHQVTIDGTLHRLPDGFFVVATQNPVEFEGVYPLPEAQLDRFLLRVEMGLPEAEAELEVYRRGIAGDLAGWGGSLPEAVISAEEARALRRASRGVHVRDDLIRYVARLASEVRDSPHVEVGVSPRAVLSLLEAARGYALIDQRDYVVPDDLKELFHACWAHRILLTPESELEGFDRAKILETVLASVEVPQ